jgi:methylmalonyl-CoA epimerase
MRLDHVGIAVHSIDETARLYAEAFGLRVTERYATPSAGVRLAFIPAGGVDLELLEPAGDGPVSTFLASHGPGLHHLAFRVPDIHRAIAEAVNAGCRAVDAAPRPGARGHLIAFLHPASAGGVLIEFVQAGHP